MSSPSFSRFLAVTMLVLAFLVIGFTTAFAGTARSSGVLVVRAGPGNGYAAIGRLARGERVELDRCTRSGRWCLVYNGDRGGAEGWVQGSYLIGSPAKVEATPPTFLVPFGDPLFGYRRQP